MKPLLGILCSLLLIVPGGSASGTAATQNRVTSTSQPVLEDGTPVKLRMSQTVSSADAHVDDRVEFEVLEEVLVGDVVVIPKGGIAWGTVTEAVPKRRMARGGKLEIVMDSVRLVDGKKAAVRATKDAKGGGHTGAMTAGIVATGLIFWPAAPFFLFMHGKDISIPKGAEVPTFINGNVRLDPGLFRQAQLTPTQSPTQPSQGVSPATVAISSNPAGAEISVDQNFIGNTPSSTTLGSGKHVISIKKSGFQDWEREIVVSGGNVNLSAELIPGAAPSVEPVRKSVAVASNVATKPTQAEYTSRTAIQPIAAQQTHPGWIGVTTKRAKGGSTSITKIVANGPADKAGLKVGDIIVALNGTPITDQDFEAEIARCAFGSKIKVGYLRDAWRSDATVTVSLEIP
jgi:PDZ domain/PEGA domain